MQARLKMALLAVTLAFPAVLAAADKAPKPAPPLPGLAIPADSASYADIADLVVASPLIVDATIRSVTKISPEQAVGVPVTLQRTIIVADVMTLIRGTEGVSSQVRFLLDVPKDAKGKLPPLKKQRLFVLGSLVAGHPGDIKLARPDALIQWSATNDALLRSITKEAVQIDAPQKVTEITSAFYSGGTVLGEGETQIFLRSAGAEPYSISVLSRPGQAKAWSVSMGDVIDPNAGRPKQFTLLWYRLACSLPKTLPYQLVESDDAENRAHAQADYSFVIESLGPCGRKRNPR